MTSRYSRACFSLCLLGLLIFSTPNAQYQSARAQSADTAAEKFVLAGVEIDGLQRYKSEDIIAASGLKTSESVTLANFKTAAQQLYNTGLFTKVSYQYNFDDKGVTVKFLVAESGDLIKCTFDNFIWYSHSELNREIAKDIPAFIGYAPKSGTAVDAITKSLTRLVRARNLTGEVEYEFYADPATGRTEHLFSYKGEKMPVREIRFPGASGITESTLASKMKPLVGENYSEKSLILYAEANLLPLYRERGYLRARFAEPQAQPGEEAPRGLAISLPVVEGPAYSIEAVNWQGVSAISAATASETLNLKGGELANGVKLSSNLQALKHLYNSRGYLEAKLLPVPAYDDTNHRVSLQINVTEGEQYRMGKFDAIGFSDDDAARLKKKWTLAAGEIFNTDYLNDYVKKFSTIVKPSSGKEVHPVVKPNHDTHTVDVTFKLQ